MIWCIRRFAWGEYTETALPDTWGTYWVMRNIPNTWSRLIPISRIDPTSWSDNRVFRREIFQSYDIVFGVLFEHAVARVKEARFLHCWFILSSLSVWAVAAREIRLGQFIHCCVLFSAAIDGDGLTRTECVVPLIEYGAIVGAFPAWRNRGTILISGEDMQYGRYSQGEAAEDLRTIICRTPQFSGGSNRIAVNPWGIIRITWGKQK